MNVCMQTNKLLTSVVLKKKKKRVLVLIIKYEIYFKLCPTLRAFVLQTTYI